MPEETRLPKKDSKGNDITPHITKAIVKTEEQKDSRLKKAVKVFFSEDIDHVTDSIVDEFVKPRAKSFGMDLVRKTKEFLYTSFVDFAGSLFFDRRSNNSSYNRGNSSYTSYSNYSKDYNYSSYSEPDNYYYYNGAYYKNDQPPERVRHDIVRERPIKDYGKAKQVLDDLKYIIRTTEEHYAFVGDYYVAIGVTPSQLDYDWVWAGNMLDNCKKPKYTNRGYILELPRPIPKP